MRSRFATSSLRFSQTPATAASRPSTAARRSRLMEKERPDLVLADLMMPVLSGADLCRQTKASSDRRSIPVILMSSAGRRSADETGADAFIPKPFDLDHIEALVQRWLAPQQSRQARKTHR